MWVFRVLLVATVLSQNSTPSLAQLGSFYFETLNQSQIWINLEPQGSIPGPNPIRLNFTVAFTGRILDRAPDIVEVRAESMNTAFPMRIRQPILRFHLGGSNDNGSDCPGQDISFYWRVPGLPGGQGYCAHVVRCAAFDRQFEHCGYRCAWICRASETCGPSVPPQVHRGCPHPSADSIRTCGRVRCLQ